MPGWYGKFIADAAEKNVKKALEKGNVEAAANAAQDVIFGRAAEKRLKEKGILGGLKDIGKIGVATVGGLISGGPAGAAAGFASGAASVSAKAKQAQAKAVGNMLGDLAESSVNNTGIGGGLNVKSKNQKDVSLLGNIINTVGNAAVKFTKTGVGQAATGILKNYVANLATPKPQGSSNLDLLAQVAGTYMGNPVLYEGNALTGAQNSLFGNKSGLSVNLPVPGTDWWSQNKGWFIPVVATGGGILLIGLLFMIFRRR